MAAGLLLASCGAGEDEPGSEDAAELDEASTVVTTSEPETTTSSEGVVASEVVAPDWREVVIEVWADWSADRTDLEETWVRGLTSSRPPFEWVQPYFSDVEEATARAADRLEAIDPAPADAEYLALLEAFRGAEQAAADGFAFGEANAQAVAPEVEAMGSAFLDESAYGGFVYGVLEAGDAIVDACFQVQETVAEITDSVVECLAAESDPSVAASPDFDVENEPTGFAPVELAPGRWDLGRFIDGFVIVTDEPLNMITYDGTIAFGDGSGTSVWLTRPAVVALDTNGSEWAPVPDDLRTWMLGLDSAIVPFGPIELGGQQVEGARIPADTFDAPIFSGDPSFADSATGSASAPTPGQDYVLVAWESPAGEEIWVNWDIALTDEEHEAFVRRILDMVER